MALHLVTGYAGEEHVTSADQGSFNAGVVGNGQIVLDRGEKVRAEIISNNTVRIYDGDILMQGRHIRVATDTFEELTIENGSQLMKRHDLIVARYEKDLVTLQESAWLSVIKGAPSENPVDPDYEQGNLFGGDPVNEMPLYRAKLDGLTLVELEPMFSVSPAIGALTPADIGALPDTTTPADIGAVEAPSGTVPGPITGLILLEPQISSGAVSVRFDDPADPNWAGTILVRKAVPKVYAAIYPDYPTNPSDGIVVLNNTTRGRYGSSLNAFRDASLSNDFTYFYRFFTYNQTGKMNTSTSGSMQFTYTPKQGAAWAGTVSVTTIAANTPAYVEVPFTGANFSEAPAVCVTADTAFIGAGVFGASVNNVTATGCRVYVTRTNAATTTVHVIAREKNAV